MRQWRASRGPWLQNRSIASLEVSENCQFDTLFPGSVLTEKNFANISGSKLSCCSPAPSPTSVLVISVKHY